MGIQQCFCGSGRPFARCCEPYLLADLSMDGCGDSKKDLQGQAAAPTAEALMRSRYSAFCQGNIDYLIATHHPSIRTSDMRTGLAHTILTTRWTNLQIVSKQKGQKKDKTGVVEFVAAYRSQRSTQPRELEQLHERSRFVREGGRWFYVSGDMLPLYQPKRSHPCWCGSRKPFKHCHG